MVRPVMERVAVDVEVRRPAKSSHADVHAEQIKLAVSGVDLGGAVERGMKCSLRLRRAGCRASRQQSQRKNHSPMLVQSHIKLSQCGSSSPSVRAAVRNFLSSRSVDAAHEPGLSGMPDSYLRRCKRSQIGGVVENPAEPKLMSTGDLGRRAEFLHERAPNLASQTRTNAN